MRPLKGIPAAVGIATYFCYRTGIDVHHARVLHGFIYLHGMCACLSTLLRLNLYLSCKGCWLSYIHLVVQESKARLSSHNFSAHGRTILSERVALSALEFVLLAEHVHLFGCKWFVCGIIHCNVSAIAKIGAKLPMELLIATCKDVDFGIEELGITMGV